MVALPGISFPSGLLFSSLCPWRDGGGGAFVVPPGRTPFPPQPLWVRPHTGKYRICVQKSSLRPWVGRFRSDRPPLPSPSPRSLSPSTLQRRFIRENSHHGNRIHLDPFDPRKCTSGLEWWKWLGMFDYFFCPVLALTDHCRHLRGSSGRTLKHCPT